MKNSCKTKQKEDQERGLQALVDMQKQEEKADDVSEYSGPLVIGLTIRDDTEFKRLRRNYR